MNRIWSSEPPSNIPFEKSKELKGIEFTGKHKEYEEADTWYFSWASDDNLYSPWTDGSVQNEKCWSASFKFMINLVAGGNLKPNSVRGKIAGILDELYNSKKYPATGNAKVVGNDPMKLKVINLGVNSAASEPYAGRYPCANLVYDGVWFYGTHCRDTSEKGKRITPEGDVSGPFFDIMGPLVGFRISKDYGNTWIECPHKPDKPLFGESGKEGNKIKFGAPNFIDFGKNMEYSPDGKAYLVGHGGERKDAEVSWLNGDQIYMARVTPTIENINNINKYEFFAGNDKNNKPIWNSNFNEIKPLIEWEDNVGTVAITYNNYLNKYLMCVTESRPDSSHYYNTYILESNLINGPWCLVVYMKGFGGQGYFVNIPSKFINSKGETVWLCYSSNWIEAFKKVIWDVSPEGSKYALCLQEIKFITN